jgi:uncharacterized protein YbcC (UPF0753/DUF2309 family)
MSSDPLVHATTPGVVTNPSTHEHPDPNGGENVIPTPVTEPETTAAAAPHGPVDDGVVLDVRSDALAACSRVAPLWPLDRFVAVNPYLGLGGLRFDAAAELLARVSGARTTMPVQFYLDALEGGVITSAAIGEVLARHPRPPVGDVGAFVAYARGLASKPTPTLRVPTVASVARDLTGDDWSRFATDRISGFASAYFDQGQAVWRASTSATALYDAWKHEASLDRTPEILGLRGFRSEVRQLPDEPGAVLERALDVLAVPASARRDWFHALLARTGGWAAHAARFGWEAAQRREPDDTLFQLLVVGVAWEIAVAATSSVDVLPAWHEAITAYAASVDSGVAAEVTCAAILQDAYDLSVQGRLIGELAAGAALPPAAAPTRPEAQAVFCIDVRSEVLRRHLEGLSPGIDTIGFAGFFGFPVEYRRLAHEHGDAQCPVLLTPAVSTPETAGGPTADEDAIANRRLDHHVRRAWKSFKMGAISCFSFVGPIGLAYLPKLITDSAGATRPIPAPDVESLPKGVVGHTAPDPSNLLLAERAQLAEGALRGMSLTTGLAPLVALVGHGSTTVNNPYATGLDCGACGGHTGAANARVAAAVLNDPEVRAELARREIPLPEDTWFVAALHDTTRDEVVRFDDHLVPATHRARVAALDDQLAAAGARARLERAARLGIDADADVDAAVRRRSTDWAQVRPEWGLAGCRAFIAAPRSRTAALDLHGRAFLHSYDWTVDAGFGVLELIMTAPMIVASWITLQYYASTVEPRIFGSGNKTLHNVVGQLGVLEGNAGDLRVGLPIQSVHDGERLQHEPLRLAVIIQAPIPAIDDVLARHHDVRDLVDHGWIHLLALGDDGTTHRYVGDLTWVAVDLNLDPPGPHDPCGPLALA